MKLYSLLVAAALGAPMAAAVGVCEAGVCVGTNSWDYGDGCEGANADSFRGAYASASVGNEYHQVYAQNWCYAFAWDEYREEGSGIGVGYFGFGDTGYRTLGLWWYGYEWSYAGEPGEPYCAIVLFNYGFDPLPAGSDGVDCPNGERPGVIVPALP